MLPISNSYQVHSLTNYLLLEIGHIKLSKQWIHVLCNLSLKRPASLYMLRKDIKSCPESTILQNTAKFQDAAAYSLLWRWQEITIPAGLNLAQAECAEWWFRTMNSISAYICLRDEFPFSYNMAPSLLFFKPKHGTYFVILRDNLLWSRIRTTPPLTESRN